MRQHDTQTSVMLTRGNAFYLVTLQRLKNDVNGVPRYTAYITNLAEAELAYKLGKYHGTCAHVYTFKGHYDTAKAEAEFILDAHLNKGK